MKDRSDQLIEDLAGKLIMHPEIDLARLGSKRNEAPVPVETMKRPAQQRDVHRARRVLHVLGGEVLLDIVVVDMKRRPRDIVIALQYLGAAAPGKKLRI